MTILCTYESCDYSADKITARYVKYVESRGFVWCECARGKFGWLWDYRQGTCDEADLPDEVAARARDRAGTWPPYVDWPAVEPDAYGRTGEQFNCDCCAGTGVEYGETCVTCGGLGWLREGDFTK